MKRSGAQEAVANDAEVAWRGQPDGRADREALDVADLAEACPASVAAPGVDEKDLDRVVPSPDALDVGQRFE